MIRSAIVLLATVILAGCDKPLGRIATKVPTAAPQVLPDDVSNGPRYIIKGHVVWKGEAPLPPNLPAVFGKVDKFSPPLNAYFPKIDEKGQGLANVVVSVRIADKWRPPLAKTKLKLSGGLQHLEFGETETSIAAATVGSEVELKSGWDKLSLIRARGAAFYSLTFPDKTTVHTRVFDKAGTVDFANANGDYWAVARVHIFDHPWFAVTDAAGRFEIKDVPLGNHDLVAEVADFRMEKYERDPDTQAIMRIEYKPPVNLERKVFVNCNLEEKFEVGNCDFR